MCSRSAHHVCQIILYLPDQLNQQSKREGLVTCCQSYQKMILERLDCPLGCIDAVIMGFHDLDPIVFLFKINVYCLGCNIVHDVEAWFEASLCQVYNLVLENSNHCFVLHILDGFN